MPIALHGRQSRYSVSTLGDESILAGGDRSEPDADCMSGALAAATVKQELRMISGAVVNDQMRKAQVLRDVVVEVDRDQDSVHVSDEQQHASKLDAHVQ